MLADYPRALGRKAIGGLRTAKSRDGKLQMIFDLIGADSQLGSHPEPPSEGAPADANIASTSQTPSAGSPPKINHGCSAECRLSTEPEGITHLSFVARRLRSSAAQKSRSSIAQNLTPSTAKLPASGASVTPHTAPPHQQHPTSLLPIRAGKMPSHSPLSTAVAIPSHIPTCSPKTGFPRRPAPSVYPAFPPSGKLVLQTQTPLFA